MLREEELSEAASQLSAYRQQDEISDILNKYASLIEDYRRLKSDFEEERDAREKYKQLARSREQAPFVLVLVDGDGYVFHENFLGSDGPASNNSNNGNNGSNGGNNSGGSNAALALNNAVAHSLQAKGLDGCQIMIRVYANVSGLSKALARAGHIGNEARSLAPFVANFNRSYGLTDFVDAGSLKENADFKIRAALSFYAESPQCRHIYFAACHDVGYISELTPYLGNSDKFTLIRTAGIKFHSEFTKLGMSIESMPGVFRTTPLTSISSSNNSNQSNSNGNQNNNSNSNSNSNSTVSPTGDSSPGRLTTITNSYKSNNHSTSNYNTVDNWRKPATTSSSSLSRPSLESASYKSKDVCRFFKLGKCRFGKSCKLLHVGEGDSLTNDDHDMRSSWTSDRRSSTSADDIVPTWKGRPLRETDVPEGHVPVNESGHRLDCYLSPSAEVMARLRARTRSNPFCNKFHLSNACDAGDSCEFEHGKLPEDLRPALFALSRTMPCTRRDACRDVSCIKGHICQTADCRQRGGRLPCRLPGAAHTESYVCAHFVLGRPAPPPERSRSRPRVKRRERGRASSPSAGTNYSASGRPSLSDDEDDYSPSDEMDLDDQDMESRKEVAAGSSGARLAGGEA